MDSLPREEVVALLYSCLSAMERGSTHAIALLELLPTCLTTLAAVQQRPHNDSGSSVIDTAGSGDDEGAGDARGDNTDGADAAFFQTTAVSRLLHCRQWRPEQLPGLLQVLRSVPQLTEEQLHQIIRKAVQASK